MSRGDSLPVLIVKLGENERHIPFVPDQSLRDIPSSLTAERLNELRDQAKIINLSHCLDFDDFSFENLHFKPMRVINR